ncbi:MAG TPA: D-Ala-D-Ala carboxypeptidase family metallohydrolase [Desulfomonilaceae bacterium]|nr:D-Ala-D-Ala carboxypeptidase family metallohydrolase [Desulfomonilaceae bacterium]
MAGQRGKTRKPSFSDREVPVAAHQAETRDWSEIKHFSPRDFTCTCTGFCDHPAAISLDLAKKLDLIRERLGRHITILSGTRCTRHNRRIGGTLNSPHVPKNGISHAADVHCPDSSFRFAFILAASSLFKRIGIGKDFIHVDDDPELPPDVMWTYGPDRSSANAISLSNT